MHLFSVYKVMHSKIYRKHRQKNKISPFSFLVQNKKNRIISRNSDVNLPPRSCDLIPLDYFLWEDVEDKCYANHPETIEALKHEIEVAIHGMEAQRIENVLKNRVYRMGHCKASSGSHLNDVFHS